MRRITEAVASVCHRRHRAAPVPDRLLELGLVHEALPAVWNEIRLAPAPLVERGCPFGCTGQVEELDALEDHGAVDDP